MLEVVWTAARLSYVLLYFYPLEENKKRNLHICSELVPWSNLHEFLVVVQLPDMVQPMVENHICELESFSDVFLPASSDVPFSAVDNSTAIRVGLPPRIVGRALSEQMMAHEFVGYVPNPAWRRGSPYGSATRAVAGLRNMRQTRKV